MGFDRFLIAPLDSGLQNNMTSWLLPEDALEKLSNAYVHQGNIKKRFGYRLMGIGSGITAPLTSRLRVLLGVIDGTGALSGTVPGAIFSVGQAFSIGSNMYTVVTSGVTQDMLKTGGGASTYTYDTTNGNYAFAGEVIGTSVYFFPSQPVMGYFNYESDTIAQKQLYGFDTQFVYTFSGNSWSKNGTALWHGGDSDFFWSTNWTGLTLDETYTFVSNFQVTNKTGVINADDDPMYYFDGTSTWTSFSPEILGTNPAAAATHRVFTAKIVIPFKGRLLLFNTIERNNPATTNTQYQNRCRYSHVGSPIVPANTGTGITHDHPWLEPNQTYRVGAAGSDIYKASGGGFVDAPTKEAIVSAEIIRDRVIVHFEKSVWELAFNGNYILPFVWEQLNSEMGSESTFSSVGFDKQILTVGTTGIHACNGLNVERIDDKIPKDIFKMRYENDGKYRISGIRDYFEEMVYWTFPSINYNRYSQTFPDKVLVYNYKNGTWSYNDDTFTTFGYFEMQRGASWDSVGNLTWEEATSTWDSGVEQAQAKKIVAGNQQGFCFVIEPTYNSNAPSLQITNVAVGASSTLTVIDHNLGTDDYVYVENSTVITDGIYKIISVTDSDTIVIDAASTGTYAGGGTLALVSRIDIKSKEWNPYIKDGRNVHLSNISFYVSNVGNGEITVDYYVSSSTLPFINEGVISETLFGDNPNVLELGPYLSEPLEVTQQRFWHNLSFEADGENVAIRMFYSDAQLRDKSISLSGFQLHGMMLFTLPTSMGVR